MVTPPSLARGHPFFAPVRGYCGQFKRGLWPGAVTIAAHEANGALIGYERNGPDDEDKDGTLDYNELNTMLRQGASVILDDALKVGAAGEIATQVRQTHKLRKHRAKGKALPSSVVLKVSSRLSVQQKLQQVLRDNAVRVIDIFREWDEDGDGLVSKKEFRNAVSALGYQAPREDVDAVFSLFDDFDEPRELGGLDQ
jgi:hypothetical protein